MKASDWVPGLVVIAFFGSAIGGISFGLSRCEGCYAPCKGREDVPPPKLEVEQLGSVVMPDGETCAVEEVVRRSYSPGGGDVDKENRCIAGYESQTRPLVRRIVCPSGRNGESRVGQDGSKFHNETLE